MPLRAAGVCGFLALVTSTFGWVVGGLAQPGAYSAADDDVSDLGALTASSAWVYNQIGANLTGLLVMALALGVWRSLSPDLLGMLGAGALFLVGLGVFSDGLLRLDCRGIDRGCVNDSWHADAHKMESRFTVAAFFLAPLVLAFAFAYPGLARGVVSLAARDSCGHRRRSGLLDFRSWLCGPGGDVCLVSLGRVSRRAPGSGGGGGSRQDRGLRWAARA